MKIRRLTSRGEPDLQSVLRVRRQPVTSYEYFSEGRVHPIYVVRNEFPKSSPYSDSSREVARVSVEEWMRLTFLNEPISFFKVRVKDGFGKSRLSGIAFTDLGAMNQARGRATSLANALSESYGIPVILEATEDEIAFKDEKKYLEESA